MKISKDQNLHTKEGKDPSLYEGPSRPEVYKSFVDLYTDLIDDLSPHLNRASMTLISNWILKFIDGFWKQSKSCKNGLEVKLLAEICKSRRNDLASVIDSMISGKAPAFPGDFYIVSKLPKKITSLRYFPNSFIGVINFMEEINEILSFVELKQLPGFYVYLHKIAFHLVSSFDITEEEFEVKKEKIIQILLLPVTLSQVYEHMNPSPEVMEEYGLDLLNQLRKESSEPSDRFWNLLDSVNKDIHSPKTNKNRYVHDIIDAMKSFRDSTSKEFKFSDYYLTAKASTSKINVEGTKFKLNSLYSSVIEDDPIKDQPEIIKFDNLIGYQSGYLNKYEIPSHIKVQQDLVITQMIPNPGKYKPRGIHVGCNSIQDRCKFLHRQLAEFLNQIDSCCMKQHYLGVQFLKMVTNPSYRFKNRNNVFVSDFSNATDTLNQSFQCKVIEILFNDTYADFWRFISKLPKKFRHPDRNYLEDYVQMTGQPQGLLASFDAFSLAHIILICMLMKQFNLESRSLSETLAIVGDDSVISYPCELEDNETYQETFYNFHSWLCKEVSLIKNDSKTGKSFFDNHGNYGHEVLDFAKISVRDGIFMTPIPYGLAAAYANKPGATDLQLIFWLNSKGLTYKELAYKLLFRAYCKKPLQLMVATSVLSSGMIPFFKEFEDQEVNSSIDLSIRSVSHYMFYLNQLEHTFLSSILSDSKKDCLKDDNFAIKSLNSLEQDFYNFNDSIQMIVPLLPDNHKYSIMVSKNMSLALEVQDILDSSKNREDISILLGVLMNEEYYTLFSYAIDLNDYINKCLEKDDPDIWMMFCDQDFSIFKDLTDPLKNFQVKSMKKASSNSVVVMRSSARKATQFIQESSYLKDCYLSCVSKFIDTFLSKMHITE